MGTRSITVVYDDLERPLVTMYRQFDGYISGHGRELADFLDGRVVVNGYGSGTPEKASNGMGCLAASLIANFKDGIGGFYIEPSPSGDYGQEYEYHIYPNKIVVNLSYGDGQFNGTWEDFVQYAKESDD